MARPQKCGVDWFPHLIKSGKTLFTIENKYGNDGYAFWFKLLELIGSVSGHCYNCNSFSDWSFLVAKTRVNEEKATEILDMLAALDAIDPELWSQKIIWIQNFVDGVEEVYKKRKSEIPIKPSFRTGNYNSDGISAAESTQREREIRERDKRNNSSNNETATATEPDKDFDEIKNHYFEKTGRLANGKDAVAITEALKICEVDEIKTIMDRVAKGRTKDTLDNDIKSFSYFLPAIKEARGDSSGTKDTGNTGTTREYGGGVIDYSQGFTNLP
jgi:hypothetical protein